METYSKFKPNFPVKETLNFIKNECSRFNIFDEKIIKNLFDYFLFTMILIQKRFIKEYEVQFKKYIKIKKILLIRC